MQNFKNVAESNFKDCKIKKVLYTNKVVGNTIQNNFKISNSSSSSSNQQDELDVIEIHAPELIVEKFTGKHYSFACSLAVRLIPYYGTIQFAYVEKPNEGGDVVVLVVYYSKSNNTIDENTKNQMMFYHSQQSLDLKYLTLEEIIHAAAAAKE